MTGRVPSGVGIGLRRVHFREISRTSRRVDWLEITPENFMGFGGPAARALSACAERWPVIPHGVALSLGGPDPLDDGYLRAAHELSAELGAAWFSEHACYASLGGAQSYDLLPLPFCDEAASHLARRAREAAERIERPLLLENITYYAVMPGTTLDEGAFLRAVLDEADCGFLLDVNNVYVNAKNHGLDPEAALLALPLDRTRQIHMAGHRRDGNVLIDDHGSAVPDAVWSLYELAIEHVGPVPTLIEWDNQNPESQSPPRRGRSGACHRGSGPFARSWSVRSGRLRGRPRA